MRVLFEINHPAHFHLLKNYIKHAKRNGNFITIVSRNKDVTNDLLNSENFDYISLSNAKKGLFFFFIELLIRNIKIFILHKKNSYDIAMGCSVSIAHLSLISKVKSFVFAEDDDDVTPLFGMITYPFATKIINPECIRHKKWKSKRVLIPSYHELAYLHPENFNPNAEILKKYKLKKGNYIILRLSALNAHHDIKAKGLDNQVLDEIKKITKEFKLVESMENNTSHQIEPIDMHHILAFSKMIISDSQTMSVEASVLGVPSLRFNSFAKSCSVLNELEKKYHLTYGFNYNEKEMFLNKVQTLLNNKTLKKDWDSKRNILLKDKINLNSWMIKFFENETNII
tara:strand:+ start:610 stop:1632 length:1023 start_codon:yes stop_codon:yes gene_type:complete